MPGMPSEPGSGRGVDGRRSIGWNAVNAWFDRSKSGQVLRRRILHFAPSWFTVIMGTGIVSILLHQLPYQFKGLRIISIVVFVFNVILFFLFLLLSILRYALWPSVLGKMLLHPMESLFLGAIPMGFATIVNMIVYVCVPAWGDLWVQIAWAFWWIDAVLATIIGIGIPFMMFRYHSREISQMDGSWLFGVLAPIVASSTGAIVAAVLPPAHASLTIAVSYILWGCGIPLAFMMLVLLLYRLVMHNFPVPAAISSMFMAIGPPAMGGYTILQLSFVIRQLAMKTGDGLGTSGAMYSSTEGMMMASAIYGGTIVVAFVFWGMGFFWLTIAISSVISVAMDKGLRFSIGWWAFTFPTGVFVLLTNQLGTELDSTAFKVLTAILSVCVLIIWIYVIVRTAHTALTGFAFPAPSVDKDDGLSVFNRVNEESVETGAKEADELEARV